MFPLSMDEVGEGIQWGLSRTTGEHCPGLNYTVTVRCSAGDFSLNAGCVAISRV